MSFFKGVFRKLIREFFKKLFEPSKPTSQQRPSKQQYQRPQQQQQYGRPPTQGGSQQIGSGIDGIFQQLWELDSRDRLIVGRDLQLNLQNATKVFQSNDKCKDPLFDSSFNLKKYLSKTPTANAFYRLLNDYTSDTGVAETVGNDKIARRKRFIDELLKQPTMQLVFNFLVQNSTKFRSMYPNCTSINNFGEVLYNVWFQPYKRVVQNDSSAFEHTFVGETNQEKHEVSGMHNWITVCKEEKAGKVDYQGYIRRRTDNVNTQVLSFQIRWSGYVKPVSTFFIGSSPHFELALYTLVFLATDNDDNTVTVPGSEPLKLNIKCHRFQNRSGQQLGSIYPEVPRPSKM